MKQKCTLYLVGYDSPSGYVQHWETDGEMEEVEYPFFGEQGPNWVQRFILVEGQHLFLRSEPNDDTVFAKLIRVPSDTKAFFLFCEQADLACGQQLYDHLLAHKHGPRLRPLARLALNADFDGTWLDEYLVRDWQWKTGQDEELQAAIPSSLAEALQQEV